jgi:hypothetical protein
MHYPSRKMILNLLLFVFSLVEHRLRFGTMRYLHPQYPAKSSL